MIRRLRELHPESNIVPIDYDPGATRVNQENRIKLMLSVARERLAEREMPPRARGSVEPSPAAANDGGNPAERVPAAMTN